MKQLISIIGNICTGKSQVCQALIKLGKLGPAYTHLSIDEYRLEYGNEKIYGEQLAYNKLHEDVIGKENVILETSGTSEKIDFLYGAWEKMGGALLIVKLDCARSVLLERLMERAQSDYPKIPFPYKITKEEAIRNIDEKLTKKIHHLTFNTHEKSATEIAEEILAKVKEKARPAPLEKGLEKPKIPPKKPTKIKAISEIRHCLNQFSYTLALELFKKHQPKKTYVIAKLERSRNKKNERILKRELQALLSNPFVLIEKSEIKPVVNYTKIAEATPGKSPRKIYQYPKELQELIIKKSGLIAGKKKLSNSLFSLKEKPEEATAAVTEILKLKAEIDGIEKAQKHFERNDKLPNKLERQLEVVPQDAAKLDLSIRNTRSRISKLKGKISRAKASGKDGLLLKYGNDLEKEEMLLKKYLQEKQGE